MGLTEFLLNFFTVIIAQLGYFGVFLLMVAESMVLPVPSEAIMPFAGFLWHQGSFNFWLIALASTSGSIAGSLISYYIGFYSGRPLIKKFGKYFFLNEHHLEITERFFTRYGEKAIFFSRFVPIVRHLISLPAGVGKMKLIKFCLYTISGAFLWNGFLACVGYYLAENWNIIRKYTEILDIFIIIIIIATAIYLIYRRYNKKI